MRATTGILLCLIAAGSVWSLPASGQEPATAAPAPAAAVKEQAPAPVAPPKTYYESLEISISGKAENNGSISMEFLPFGGTPKVINVNVLAKTKAKDVTRDLGKELTIAGGSLYKVKVKSDSILVKKASSKGQNVSVSLTGQTVNGVAILVRKN